LQAAALPALKKWGGSKIPNFSRSLKAIYYPAGQRNNFLDVATSIFDQVNCIDLVFWTFGWAKAHRCPPKLLYVERKLFNYNNSFLRAYCFCTKSGRAVLTQSIFKDRKSRLGNAHPGFSKLNFFN